MENTQLIKTNIDSAGLELNCSLCDVDSLIKEGESNLVKYDEQISKTLYSGDNIDLAVAAGSGVLCGIIDAVFLQELDLSKAQNVGTGVLEPIIKRMGKSSNIEDAVKNLEQRTTRSFASDPNLGDFGGGLQHHLRDFAHHVSPLGLFFSLLTQFTGMCYGTNTAGKFISTAVIDKSRIGSTVGEKLSNGIIEWFFHIASDMNGSTGHVGGGTGLPGPILSIAKELSAVLPTGKDGRNKVSELISKMYNGTLFADHDANGKIIVGTEKRLDFRTEIGMAIFQSIPVLLNMTAVRIFYFVRRLIAELKKKKEDDQYVINWKNLFPFLNPTITRMTTVSSATFSAIDLTGAIIVSAAKSGGTVPGFVAHMVLNVNFVGLGKMCMSFGNEMMYGIKHHSFEKKKYAEIARLTQLYQAKIYICEGKLLQEIKDTDEAMNNLKNTYDDVVNKFIKYTITSQKSIDEIKENLEDNQEMSDFINSQLD